MILGLERDFGLGLGGFAQLAREDQAVLLAYARVHADPTGQRTDEPTTVAGRVRRLRAALQGR